VVWDSRWTETISFWSWFWGTREPGGHLKIWGFPHFPVYTKGFGPDLEQFPEKLGVGFQRLVAVYTGVSKPFRRAIVLDPRWFLQPFFWGNFEGPDFFGLFNFLWKPLNFPEFFSGIFPSLNCVFTRGVLTNPRGFSRGFFPPDT